MQCMFRITVLSSSFCTIYRTSITHRYIKYIVYRYPFRSLLVCLAWYHYSCYSFHNFTKFPLSHHAKPDQISISVYIYIIRIHRLYAIVHCVVFCALLLSRCSKFVNSFVDAPSNLLATFCSRFTFAKLSIDDRIIISRRWSSSSSSSSSLSLSLGFTVRSSPLCIQDQITRKKTKNKKNKKRIPRKAEKTNPRPKKVCKAIKTNLAVKPQVKCPAEYQYICRYKAICIWISTVAE